MRTWKRILWLSVCVGLTQTLLDSWPMFQRLRWMNASAISHDHALFVGRLIATIPMAFVGIVVWWLTGKKWRRR